MSRKRTSDSVGSKFKRLLGWTVLMAIVFSAGLITGERLVRRQALAPLVSVTGQVAPADAEEDSGDADPADGEDKPTSFAFFDQLTRKDNVSLSANRKAKQKASEKAEKPEQKAPKKEEPKPEEPAKQPAENAPEADKPEPREEKPAANEQAQPEPKPAEAEPVEQEAAPSPAEEVKEQPAENDEPAAARYTLQVSAHPDMDSARGHMEKLRKMGLEPHVVAGDIPGKGKFYRVRVGKFQSMDEARSFQSDLKRKNSLSTFVSPL